VEEQDVLSKIQDGVYNDWLWGTDRDRVIEELAQKCYKVSRNRSFPLTQGGFYYRVAVAFLSDNSKVLPDLCPEMIGLLY
jgi:hypothetical protein